MNDFQKQELSAVAAAYEVLIHWAKTRHIKGMAFEPPGYIVWRLADVPALKSFTKKSREVVAMSGLYLWENGNMKHSNVGMDEAIDWLL